MTAAARFTGPTSGTGSGGQWDVLTDQRDWDQPLLNLPSAPGAWYQLAAIGGWQAVVADTQHAAAVDVLVARQTEASSLTERWCQLPCSVPVWCAAATGAGVAALQSTMSAAIAAGLRIKNTVVALVATGEGRLPARVQATETMLAPMVAAVVRIPFDPHIRSHGLADAVHLKPRTQHAARSLATAVTTAASNAFGSPLPPAPQPVMLHASTSSTRALSAREPAEVPA